MTPNKWWPPGRTPSNGESEPVKYVTKEEVQEMQFHLDQQLVMKCVWISYFIILHKKDFL